MPIVLVDSTTLGVLANPRNYRDPVQCRAWAKRLGHKNISVVIPGISDYEIRRELIHQNLPDSVKFLDSLKEVLPFLPINGRVMDKAAELWAWARKTNQATANGERLDGDVILAAQAIILGSDFGQYVVVATDNVRHIERYTPAKKWRDITVESCLNPNLGQSTVLSTVSKSN